MDVIQLAQSLTLTLVPYLPFLRKLGEKATEETIKHMTGDAWEGIKGIWTKLHPKIESNAVLQFATTNVAKKQEELQNQPEKV